MKMPNVVPFSFPPDTYLVLDEGQENEVLKDAYLVTPTQVETVIETEEGPKTITETKYKIMRRVYEDVEIEPLSTQDAAVKRAVSEMINNWSNKYGSSST